MRQLCDLVDDLRVAVLPANRMLAPVRLAEVMADLVAGKDGLVTLFKLLKGEHPEILSILVTEDGPGLDGYTNIAHPRVNVGFFAGVGGRFDLFGTTEKTAASARRNASF